MAGSTIIRELLVALGVDADTAGALDFDKALGKVKSTMELAAKAAVAVAGGISAVVGAAAAAVVSTSSYSQEVERNAKALGLTAQAYQELFYAAGKYGQNTGDFLDTMNQIAQYARMATTGSKEAVDAFGALGISVADLQGIGLDDLLARVADGIAKIQDPTQRAGLSSTIFGEEGTRQLLPLLVQGSAGIDALRQTAEELGIVLDDSAVAKSAAFAGQLSALKTRAEALWRTIGVLLLPVFVDIADRVEAWIDDNDALLKQDIPALLRKVADYGRDAVAKIDELRKSFDWSGAEAVLTRVAAAITTVGVAIAAAKAASVGWELLTLLAGIGTVGAVPLLLVASALAYVVALFTAWYLVIQDVYTYLSGGDSVLGDLIAKYPQLGGAISSGLGLASSALGLFKTVMTTVWDLLKGFVSWAGGGLIELLAVTIPEALGIKVPNAAAAATAALEFVAGAFDRIAAAMDSATAEGQRFNALLEGAGGAPTASPSTSTTGGVAASANLAGAGGATSSSRTYRGGDANVTVNGAGWTPDQVSGIAREVVAEQNRAAYAAYGGA